MLREDLSLFIIYVRRDIYFLGTHQPDLKASRIKKDHIDRPCRSKSNPVTK